MIDGVLLRPEVTRHVARRFLLNRVSVKDRKASRRDSWLRGTRFSLGLDDVFNETPALHPDPPIGFNYGWVARPQGRFWRVTVKRAW